jgi:ankyrin repeat protein
MGRTPFHRACFRNNIKLLEFFLEMGFSIDGSSKAPDTPLMSACERGQAKVVKFLLERGANVNGAGKKSSPLARAAYYNCDECVRILLAYNANTERKDDEGCTPLMVAMHSASPKCMKELIRGGANVEARGPSGKTPIMFLTKRNDVSWESDQREKVICLQTLVDAGANLEARDGDGKTALIHASDDKARFTWSHIVEANIIGTPIVNKMLELGANVHAVDNNGNTALIRATFMGNLACVYALMRAGSDPDAKNNQGVSARDDVRSMEDSEYKDAYFKALNMTPHPKTRKAIFNSLREGNANVNANTEFLGSDVMPVDNVAEVRKGDYFYNTSNVTGNNRVPRVFHKDLLEHMRNSGNSAQKNPMTRRPWPLKKAEISQILKKVANNASHADESTSPTNNVVGGRGGRGCSARGRGAQGRGARGRGARK